MFLEVVIESGTSTVSYEAHKPATLNLVNLDAVIVSKLAPVVGSFRIRYLCFTMLPMRTCWCLRSNYNGLG